MARLFTDVCYVSRSPRKTKNLLENEILVRDTFAYNPESKTAPSTAQRWASARVYNRETQSYSESPEAEIHSMKNEPFEVTVVDLEARGEGGRAYKIIDSENRLFDLREDQVTAVMSLCGILPGGKIPGEFVWGSLSSQTRVVLVGSELHKAMVENAAAEKRTAEKRKAGEGLTPSKLISGRMYKTKSGQIRGFLGRCKLPGANKVTYAFLDFYAADAYKRLFQEKFPNLSWDALTWDEKLEFENKMHSERNPPGKPYRSVDCVLSPNNIEDEIGEFDYQSYRIPSGGGTYRSSNSWQLHEDWYEKIGCKPHNSYSYNHADRVKTQEALVKWSNDAYDEYTKAIVWL